MTLNDALDLLEEKASKQHKEGTIKNYKSRIRSLANFFDNISIEDVTLAQMQDFLNTRAKRDKASYHTIQVDLYALEFFYNKVLNKNYDFRSIRNPATQGGITTTEFFAKEEIKKLLEAVKTTRYRLVFALMYHFEMDRGDIIELKAENVTEQGDGGMALKSPITRRWENIPGSLEKELQEYRAMNNPKKWFFEVKGEKIKPEAVHTAFNKALRRAGITKKLSLKSLSDSHVEHSKQLGVDLIDEILTINTPKISDAPVLIIESPNFEAFGMELKFSNLLSGRWNEIQKCLQGEAYLASIILMGSLLEGILSWSLSQLPKESCSAIASPKDTKTGKPKKISEWKFGEMIDVAHELRWLEIDVKRFSHSLREFRNLVHPNQQLKENVNPTKDTCYISWQVVQAAVNNLTENFIPLLHKND